MKQKVTEGAVLVNALQGGLLPEDISVIQAELQKIDTELVVHEYPSYAINGIEIFFPQIQLFLSNPIVQTIAYGAAGSAVFEAIKAIGKQLWRITQRRGMSIIKKHEIIEDMAPNIHLTAGKFHAILPADISEEEFECFITGFMAAINKVTVSKENYFIYDPVFKQTAVYSKGKLVEKVSGGKYLANE